MHLVLVEVLVAAVLVKLSYVLVFVAVEYGDVGGRLALLDQRHWGAHLNSFYVRRMEPDLVQLAEEDVVVQQQVHFISFQKENVPGDLRGLQDNAEEGGFYGDLWHELYQLEHIVQVGDLRAQNLGRRQLSKRNKLVQISE